MHWVWMNSTPAAIFLARLGNADFKGVGKGVGSRSDKHPGRSLYLVAAEELSLHPASVADHLNELHGVNVERHSGPSG